MNATSAAAWRKPRCRSEGGSTMNISEPGRGFVRCPGRGFVRRLGLAAAAVFVLAASSQQRAEALSLASPGTAPSAKHATDGMAIQVRGGHHGGGHGGGGGGGFRGGGGGFHGGGGALRAGGGVAIRSGSFRAAPVFRGGPRYSGIRYGGYRVAPHHRHHHFHRRFYAPAYYDYPRTYAYPRRYCRVIRTYYGPRKICRYRPWLRHHHWRHRVHFRYW